MKFLGLDANVTPPPLHKGLLMVPALALPVPFCLYGFLPPPLTSDLFFCFALPCLEVAKKLTTEYDACIRRGIQGINLCSIQKGNTELMESLVLIALTN